MQPVRNILSGDAGLTSATLGSAETAASSLSAEHAQRLAAFLDADIHIEHGDVLPLLWHWAFFAPVIRSSDVGHDGHARLPGDGPTAGLPRRMWAGGQVVASGMLRSGVDAVRRTTLASATRKTGRSGPLLLVTLEHEIEQDGRVVITERQDLIYRPGGSTMPVPVPGPAVEAPAGGWIDEHVMDAVRLFRFSALTFNSHRIHFDREYTVNEEGYPGLVVHSPLTALLLGEACRRRTGAIRSFSFRATAPHFADATFFLVGMPGNGATQLRAVRCDGAVAMEASAA